MATGRACSGTTAKSNARSPTSTSRCGLIPTNIATPMRAAISISTATIMRKRCPTTTRRSASNPDHADALNTRCLTKAVLGRPREGLADCEASLRLKAGRSPTRSTAAAFCYLKLGELDMAIDDFTAALKRQPEDCERALRPRIGEAEKGRRERRRQRSSPPPGPSTPASPRNSGTTASTDSRQLPLDTAGHSAVWACTMTLNRTNRRAAFRRRSCDDDGLRHVRRHR